MTCHKPCLQMLISNIHQHFSTHCPDRPAHPFKTNLHHASSIISTQTWPSPTGMVSGAIHVVSKPALRHQIARGYYPEQVDSILFARSEWVCGLILSGTRFIRVIIFDNRFYILHGRGGMGGLVGYDVALTRLTSCIQPLALCRTL